ncbi:redoxin domain-containing protein [Haloferax chudinovii]|uniref:Redoxin domain-containing protein n=1 Tax=Haloferax chudinovii TaxID=1109010 RepID=A0ABD5XQJ6_9EURY
MVKLGETASDFTLDGTQGDEIREFTLSEFADGRPVAVVFYIYDYSPVCTKQMCEINEMEYLTFNDDIRVLGISTDGPYSHQRFIADNNISYPLLTDDEKHVYEQYGMVERSDEGRRNAKRGIVLVDSERTVRYRWQADDTWDDWQNQPLQDIHGLTEELTQ